MEDRRQKDRKKTGVFFGVYNRDNAKYVGRLVDISNKGMMIIGKSAIKVNEICKLRMDLPEPIKDESQIVFDARCKWCEESQKTNLFSVGFEFDKIEPNNSKLIEALVNHPLYNDASGVSPISVIIESQE
jgi:c-di-GMP-binding flagellar brake protein YcgR